ncbi:polymorphic toxin-type HINT domain-containing protein, partial [Streptomyces sp. NPDC093109]|uniref:polymorphic toxin-type HINT domain-containing protein n=1 Tax=Streptomyces sp. NPDC093109 TaxID=3154977 RepID=UPI0034507A0C
SEPCGSLCKIGGFFKKYKTEIITITVEVTVGVACGAVAVGAGAVTGGVGAVAVGASCGAIAGAAGAAVGNAMNPDADHSIAGYGTAIGKGALIGGISGAAGGALGNVAAKGIKAVGSKLISRTGKTGGAGGAKAGGATAGTKAAAAKPVQACFLAGTPVLLADGTTKNIEDIKVGDQVLATNPATGETSTQPVTELLPSEGDKELNKLTIATPDGNKNITATAEHPFWAPKENAWINAADLKPGTTLHTPNGTTAKIVHNQPYTDHVRTYNFSVAKLHTYYVLAGKTPVLVHNTCGEARFSTGSNGVTEDLANPLPARGGYVKPPTLEGGRMNIVGNKIWGNSDPGELIGTRTPESLRGLASRGDAEKLQDFYQGAVNAGKGGAAGRGAQNSRSPVNTARNRVQLLQEIIDAWR